MYMFSSINIELVIGHRSNFLLLNRQVPIYFTEHYLKRYWISMHHRFGSKWHLVFSWSLLELAADIIILNVTGIRPATCAQKHGRVRYFSSIRKGSTSTEGENSSSRALSDILRRESCAILSASVPIWSLATQQKGKSDALSTTHCETLSKSISLDILL